MVRDQSNIELNFEKCKCGHVNMSVRRGKTALKISEVDH